MYPVHAPRPSGRSYSGGIVRPDVAAKHRIARQAAEQIQISWKWYDESQGLVQWTFTNPGTAPATCVLLRNGYYFGGAFWPVYVANPDFGVSWAASLAPLADNGAANNSAPIGLLQFDDGNRQVVFLFTLAPGQTWSMLEGGFSAADPPVVQAAPTVTPAPTVPGTYCVGYDPAQVTDWDLQTGTTLQGYSPNPSTVSTVLVTAPGSPDIRLFPGDSAVDGPCSGTAPSPCAALIQKGVADLEAGNVADGLGEILDGIFCYIESGALTFKAVLKGFVERARKHL